MERKLIFTNNAGCHLKFKLSLFLILFYGWWCLHHQQIVIFSFRNKRKKKSMRRKEKQSRFNVTTKWMFCIRLKSSLFLVCMTKAAFVCNQFCKCITQKPVVIFIKSHSMTTVIYHVDVISDLTMQKKRALHYAGISSR